MQRHNTEQLLEIELPKYLRPTYHFLPEKNWMNDPNGPIYYNGEYHMFYQYNPYGKVWGDIHWGHAKSKDLVFWEHLPIALYPSYEKGEIHCFSGCAVMDGETPTLFYTSIGEGDRNHVTGAEQWVATSSDGMLTWDKPEHNPVLTKEVHQEQEFTEWRDPFVWQENNHWYMVLGGQHENKGCVLLYESKDLKEWSFLNTLYKDSSDVSVCECPNFFKLGEHYVLIFSPIHEEGHGEVKYMVGTWNDDHTFTPLHEQTLDYSGLEGYYAPTSFLDEHGRRILLGWVTEHSRGEFLPKANWSGVQAIPRVLSLTDDLRLQMKPVEAVESLRTKLDHYENISIKEDEIWQPDASGNTIELNVEVEWEENQGPFSIFILQSPDRREETEIKIDPSNGQFELVREKSSLAQETSRKPLIGRFDGLKNQLTLHAFIDRSVLEIYVNDEACMATRVYPTSEESVGISIRSDAADGLKVKAMDIWQMKSIWDQK